jgi:hypothetical protein
LKTFTLERLTLSNRSAQQESLGKRAAAAYFEGPKILVPIALRYVRSGIDPQAKLIEVGNTDGSFAHPICQVCPDTRWQVVPALYFGHQPPNTIRPSSSPKRFTSSGSAASRNFSASSKNSCCLRFSASIPFSIEHSAGAELAGFCQSPHLCSHLSWQADALTHSSICGAHGISMHHSGA